MNIRNFIFRIPCTVFICLLAVSLNLSADEGISYVYTRRDRKSQEYIQWDRIALRDGFELYQANDEGIRYFRCRPDGSIQSMVHTSPEDRVVFKAEKKGTTLIAESLGRRGAVKREISMKTDFWNQPVSTGIQNFILSCEDVLEFSLIDPAKLESVDFTFTKTDRSVLTVMDEPTDVLHLELRLSGMLSKFWKGDFWFREDDGVLVRFEGNDGPGTDQYVLELIRQSDLNRDDVYLSNVRSQLTRNLE